MKSNSDIRLLEISNLVVDLTLVGGNDNDLDALMGRLFAVLDKLPQLRLKRQGAIYMFSPRNIPVRVAQYGIKPLWLSDEKNDPLCEFKAPFSKECVIDQIQSNGAIQKLLVLPLFNGPDPLGRILLFIDGEWTPSEAEMEFMADISRALSGIISRFLLDEILRVRENELKEARTDAIRRLGTASEYRDNETGMHIMRMTAIAVAIGRAMGLSQEECDLLAITAPMHDVGKIGIADAIMLKPGRFTPEEFEVMKTHTEIGGNLLKGSDKLIATAREVALFHHECWDGSGYPAGLRGTQIPLLARICALADVFDALMSVRPYKTAWPIQQAIDMILSESGKKFDPDVVAAFTNALPEIYRIRELYREDIIIPEQIVKLPELPVREARWITWDEALNVNITTIDEHHRYLFDLTNDLIDVVANRNGSHELGRVLKALSEYSAIHFDAEERMMAYKNYNRLDIQKEQHNYFLKRLQDFHEEIHENPLVAQYEILDFLKNWLVAHIRDEDSQLSALGWH